MLLGLQPRRSRRPSLTPMIDVVFLLLVFFMLASRFGADAVVPLPLASSGGEYSGPPRLVDVTPDGMRLNGIESRDIVAELTPLMQTPSDAIILRARDGAKVQRIVTVSQSLVDAGFTSIVFLE